MHIDTFLGATAETARAVITGLRETLTAIRTSPVPTLARINGACVGAGFEMALACDVRIAHRDVRFGLPEVKLGIPSVVDAALLPAYIGLSRAKELILTGDLYSLDDLGGGDLLVNRIAEPDRLTSEVADLVARLTAPTRQVTAAQKSLFETWLNTGLAEGIATSVDVFADAFTHPATADAVATYRARTRTT